MGITHAHRVWMVAKSIQASVANLAYLLTPQAFISLSVPLPNCWPKRLFKKRRRHSPRSRWQNPADWLIYWVKYLHINRRTASLSSILENILGWQPRLRARMKHRLRRGSSARYRSIIPCNRIKGSHTPRSLKNLLLFFYLSSYLSVMHTIHECFRIWINIWFPRRLRIRLTAKMFFVEWWSTSVGLGVGSIYGVGNGYWIKEEGRRKKVCHAWKECCAGPRQQFEDSQGKSQL